MVQFSVGKNNLNKIELQWLENLWNRENMFETGVVRGSEY